MKLAALESRYRRKPEIRVHKLTYSLDFAHTRTGVACFLTSGLTLTLTLTTLTITLTLTPTLTLTLTPTLALTLTLTLTLTPTLTLTLTQLTLLLYSLVSSPRPAHGPLGAGNVSDVRICQFVHSIFRFFNDI